MSATNERSLKIQFPEHIIEIIDEWANSIECGVGVCLLCGSVIHTEDEFIPGTSTHDCSAGPALEQPEPSFLAVSGDRTTGQTFR
jgi:hypothetical protein